MSCFLSSGDNYKLSEVERNMIIKVYDIQMQDDVVHFFSKVFRENKRNFDLNCKEKDISNIQHNYMVNGCFWCALDSNSQIIGTIGLRKIEDYYEIRRFFVCKKYQHKGVGTHLINTLIDYAVSTNISCLKAATMVEGTIVRKILIEYGFQFTKRYNKSSADLFFELKITDKYIYSHNLKKLRNRHYYSLILNPTENIPYHTEDTNFFEGLYVSERFKDVNDKVIFAGRNEYINFFDSIKNIWKERLCAYDVDLKTLSGLNAHLILFLCILLPQESVLILPESCGGHFATQKILESFGANVHTMITDNKNMCVDIIKTSELINRINPDYIFVDRSEGLVYENFEWLKSFERPYKIFDASQYLSQIITKEYPSPFDWGFDMVVSTLHKNYPGPQKGIIAVNYQNDNVWQRYLDNAKTYISNTHPMEIANSIMPILDMKQFAEYSDSCIKCAALLNHELEHNGVPIVKRNENLIPTLHIWVLCQTKEESHNYYLKLEQLHILTNYRLLPYKLGFGLRIGVSAAVRQGLKTYHISELAQIMSDAYFNSIDTALQNKAKKFISKVIGE